MEKYRLLKKIKITAKASFGLQDSNISGLPSPSSSASGHILLLPEGYSVIKLDKGSDFYKLYVLLVRMIKEIISQVIGIISNYN